MQRTLTTGELRPSWREHRPRHVSVQRGGSDLYLKSGGLGTGSGDLVRSQRMKVLGCFATLESSFFLSKPSSGMLQMSQVPLSDVGRNGSRRGGEWAG